MLKTMVRCLVLATLVFAGLTAPVGVGPAVACTTGGGPDTGADGEFEYEDETCPEDNDDPTTPTTPGTGDGGGEIRCYWNDREVSCTSEYDLGVWNGDCYVKVIESEPSEESDYYYLWDGRDGGYVVLCTPWPCEAYESTPEAFPGYGCGAEYSWQPDAPEITGVAGPTPQELAERAAVAMDLDMGEIGSTPPSTQAKADSSGVIGVPIWLWVDDPAENTTGPITRTETDGGLTVTATGTLDRVEWTLTDATGEVYSEVTCAGEDAPGTSWPEDLRTGPSPTCGFDASESSRSGQLTLTGTAYWSVAWEGADTSGTVDVDPQERAATLELAEIQVLMQ